MHIVHCLVYETAWADVAGHKNPPSAPPAIPPIIINPFNRQIPPPAIDPRNTPPGPPIVPPRGPAWHM
jgi:hypothetical protein